MRYLSVTEIARKWNVSERSVRNYCAQGRVSGAFLSGKIWNIPEEAKKPERSNKRKGQPVTLDQTRCIFETNTIGAENEVFNVDDIIETANHFRCIDWIIENAKVVLTEKFIKELHLILKNGTSDSRKDWFAVGDYKKMPNEVGGMNTALPEEVSGKMKALLMEYNAKREKTFANILDFHVKFERIHPFQDDHVIIRTKLEKPSKMICSPYGRQWKYPKTII